MPCAIFSGNKRAYSQPHLELTYELSRIDWQRSNVNGLGDFDNSITTQLRNLDIDNILTGQSKSFGNF